MMSEAANIAVSDCGQCRFADGAMCTRDPRGPFAQAYETRFGDSDFCGPQRRYFQRRSLLSRFVRKVLEASK